MDVCGSKCEVLISLINIIMTYIGFFQSRPLCRIKFVTVQKFYPVRTNTMAAQCPSAYFKYCDIHIIYVKHVKA